jgi:hypothetical protein
MATSGMPRQLDNRHCLSPWLDYAAPPVVLKSKLWSKNRNITSLAIEWLEFNNDNVLSAHRWSLSEQRQWNPQVSFHKKVSTLWDDAIPRLLLATGGVGFKAFENLDFTKRRLRDQSRSVAGIRVHCHFFNHHCLLC